MEDATVSFTAAEWGREEGREGGHYKERPRKRDQREMEYRGRRQGGALELIFNWLW